MRIKELFQRLTDFLAQRQIYFKTPLADKPLAVRSFKVTKERGLKVFFHNGLSFVAKGVKILRDSITMPFDAILQGLQRLLPAERQLATEPSRPIVIPIFSLFSLLSLVGVFSLLKLL
jgi:hypothetical protein